MARITTGDEARQEYLTLMGQELGLLFYELYNEFAWLHLRWHQYRILFGTRAERIDLLNAAAGLFFRVVQDSLWDETLLHICRITDKSIIAGHETLTIRVLPSLVTDPALVVELKVLVADALTKSKFARDWRNRRIAHASLALAVRQGAKPLAAASRHDVEVALDAIGEVLNRVERHYKNSTIHFDAIGDPHDAESLLYVIRDGLESEEARRSRLEEGTPSEDDLQPPREL